MSFLQKIDELFEASCLQFSVPLKSDNFHTYIPIEIYNDTHRFQFLIRKGKKSKILILAGQQRVYLTDDQIIRRTFFRIFVTNSLLTSYSMK